MTKKLTIDADRALKSQAKRVANLRAFDAEMEQKKAELVRILGPSDVERRKLRDEVIEAGVSYQKYVAGLHAAYCGGVYNGNGYPSAAGKAASQCHDEYQDQLDDLEKRKKSILKEHGQKPSS